MALFDDLLNSADLAAFQSDFDAVWMMRRFGQDVFDHAARPLAGALIGFQDDLDRKPWPYLFPVLTAHTNVYLSLPASALLIQHLHLALELVIVAELDDVARINVNAVASHQQLGADRQHVTLLADSHP